MPTTTRYKYAGYSTVKVEQSFYASGSSSEYPQMMDSMSTTPWAGPKIVTEDYFTTGTVAGVSPVVTDVVTSQSSAGFYVKKKVNVQWKPKKPFPLTRLHRPTLKLKPPPRKPKLLPLSSFLTFSQFRVRFKTKDVTRAYQSFMVYISKRQSKNAKVDKINDRRTKEYRARYALWLKRQNAAKSRYEQRLTRYKQSVKDYASYLAKKSAGIQVWSKVGSCKSRNNLPVNPYTRVRTTRTGWYGCLTNFMTSASKNTWTYTRGPYITRRYLMRFNGSPSSATATYDPAKLQNACDKRALLKLRNGFGDQVVHVGNMVAERHKTLQMLKDLLMRALAFKRNPAREIANIQAYAKDLRLSDDYLMYVFGLKPLMTDIYNGFRALSGRINSTEAQDIITVRAGAEMTDSQVWRTNEAFIPDQITSSNWNVGCDNTTTADATCRVHYALQYKVDNESLHQLQQFGLINPTEVAWEVLPWSFVIDWFYPVGNYLRALSADAGLIYKTGTRTMITDILYKRVDAANDKTIKISNSYYTYARGMRQCTWQVETKTRIVLPTTPIRITTPEFKNPISMTHILESIALLGQRIRPR